MMGRSAFGLVFLALIAPTALAGDLRHEDPAEARLKTIAAELRCPVCQGESVYDSHATVASQMKSLIREQVAAGKTDEEIKAFFSERYGEFVLMEPRASARTAFVWVFPLVAFFGGIAGLLLFLRGRTRNAAAPRAGAVPPDSADFMRRIEGLGP